MHSKARHAAHVDADNTEFVIYISVCVREGFAPYWHVLGIAPTA